MCAGCRMDFPFKIFEVDHRVPRSRGGTDHLENLQLLCPSCNRIKGDRPQEYLVARLRVVYFWELRRHKKIFRLNRGRVRSYPWTGAARLDSLRSGGVFIQRLR